MKQSIFNKILQEFGFCGNKIELKNRLYK